MRISLSEEEYFHYLIKLKHFQEIGLLRKCLHLNNSIFPIKELEFELWLNDDIIIDKELIKKNAPKNLSNINLQIFLDSLINNNIDFYDNLSAEKYIENVNYFVDSTIRPERKLVSLFQYKELMKINTGQKFGDHALLTHVNFR